MSRTPPTEHPVRASLRRFCNRTDVAAAAGGALLSYARLPGELDGLWRAVPELDDLLGPKGWWALLLLGLIIGSITGFLLVRVAINLLDAYCPAAGRAAKAALPETPLAYRLPPFPEPGTGPFFLVLGEQHRPDGGFVLHPTWYRLPLPGLKAGLIAFGAPGTAKTNGLAYPIALQLIAYLAGDRQHRFGCLVLDRKGNFVTEIEAIAARGGRAGDVRVVRLGGYKYNPIYQPGREPAAIANDLVSLMSLLSSGKGEPDWILNGGREILTHGIGLLRLAHGYLTLRDLHALLSGPLSANADTGETPAPVRKTLEALRRAFEARAPAVEAQAAFDYHARFFLVQWPHQNPRNKATVLDATLQLLAPFVHPRVAETFCPAEHEIDFPGMEALMGAGAIVCLGLTEADGVLVTIVGTLLKLEFQRAALRRIAQAKTQALRPLFFLADECQAFLTSSGKLGAEGDPEFFALSREARVLNFLFTQSPVSLQARLGEDRLRVLLASLRSKLFLTLTDVADAQLASRLCGEAYTQVKTTTFTEQNRQARWNPLTHSLQGKDATVAESCSFSSQRRPIFTPLAFQRLKTFEAIVCGFDGMKPLEPTRIYLKPHFAPRELPHAELLRRLQQETPP